MAIINGSRFDDGISSTDGTDTIFGLAGDDSLSAGFGGEYLYGGDGDDYITSFADLSLGTTTRLYGDDGNDELGGFGGNDLLYGGIGDDFIDFGRGKDQAYGGLGFDTLDLGPVNSAVSVTLGANGTGTLTIKTADFSGTTKYTSIEGLAGTGYDDHLTGNGQSNILYGNSGNDTLSGLGGSDILFGGDSYSQFENGPASVQDHDVLTGGKGADYFAFYGNLQRRVLAAQSDTITDFDPAVDSLIFKAKNFVGLHLAIDFDAGKSVNGYNLFEIRAGELVTQTTKVAPNAGVRLIYDKDDGLLYYDADGALSGFRSTLIADIGKDLVLDASHFYLF